MNPKQLKTHSRAMAALATLVLMASLAHPLLGAVTPVRAAAGDITRVSALS